MTPLTRVQIYPYWRPKTTDVVFREENRLFFSNNLVFSYQAVYLNASRFYTRRL